MTDLTFSESGSGRPALLLHGGGGPGTVAPLLAHLAKSHHVFAATLPGWNGTERPASLASVAAYADAYAAWLDAKDLRDVVVVGSSVGGWLAAELALRTDRIAEIVIIDGGGIEVDEFPIVSIAGLAPADIAKLSFHDPSKFVLPAPTPEGLAIVQGNQAALAAIAGDPYMYDPTLLGRLGGIRVPTLVIWGESDGVFSAGYGRAYAAAIPGARFELVSEAGHLPHLEQPAAVFALLDTVVG